MQAVERAAIAVEKIRGPVLLLSASDDGSWPSSLYSRMVVERLQRHDHPHAVEHLDFEGAGHSIVFPYVPTTQLVYAHPVSGRQSTTGGAPAAALFPLFPWAAYACFGATFGSLLRMQRATLERFVVAGGLAGASLALVTSEAHHLVQVAIASVPWTVHPLRVAFRVGLVLVLLAAGWLWSANGRGSVLISCGRASLRIYWAHLLVAYGVLGHLWQKRLFMGEWAARVALLLALMWLLSRVGSVPAVPRKAEAPT